MTNWNEMTNEDALAEWDSGSPVWTCSMGGMGPGYEQVIQMMGFEFFRAMLADPFDYNALDEMSDDEKRKSWRSYRDRIEAQPECKAIVERLGPSGSQFGAAMNIASVFSRQGYAAGMATVPEDRRIMASKNFPG